MTGIVFANYHTGNQQFAIELQSYRFAQDLRNAQEMSMSAKEIAGETPFGFGVYCAQGGTSYIIYADTYPNPGGNAVYDSGSDYVIQTIDLDKNIYIQTVTPDLLSVNFAPPDPVTTLTGGAGPAVSQATIVIGRQGTAQTQTIVVNRAGLIYVQ